MNEQEKGQELPFRPPLLKLMAVIVDWDQHKKVTEILREHFVRFQYICAGIGTAGSDILDILGIGSMEKAVVLCLQPDFRVSELMRTLSDELNLTQHGMGITFSIPLSGISNPISQIFSEEKHEEFERMLSETVEPEKRERISMLSQHVKERMKNYMESELDKTSEAAAEHCLIVAVVNQGYSDDLVDAAKEAGAGGGTIIHARRSGMEDTIKFFGVSVQAEKEIVAILAKHETKKPIMNAINKSFGLASEAKGIIFSLPVDSIAGTDLDIEDKK